MRFLLVAPLLTRRDSARADAVTPSAQTAAQRRMSMRSRIDFEEKEHRQEWKPLTVAHSSSSARGDATVEFAWLAQERAQLVVVMSVTVEKLDRQVAALESRLADLAIDFVLGSPELGDLEPAWVNRTALLEGREQSPADWIEASSPEQEIAGRMTQVGWGNNVVKGWGGRLESAPTKAAGDDALRWQLIRGLVDAQVMWCELAAISDGSADVVRELEYAPKARERAKAFRALLTDAERLSSGLARHHLHYDELLLSLQGPRRAVAQALLEAWGYHGLLNRIARRMADLSNVVDSRKAGRERRYQRVVEAVLAALSVFTLLDLGLSVVSTSLIGTALVPGESSPLGIFATLRQMDADVFLLTGGLVSAAILALLLLLSRRS